MTLSLLHETYEQLKNIEIISTKADFSAMMGRSPQYFSMLITTENNASIAALTTLQAHLRALQCDGGNIDVLVAKIAQAITERVK